MYYHIEVHIYNLIRILLYYRIFVFQYCSIIVSTRLFLLRQSHQLIFGLSYPQVYNQNASG